MFYWNRVTREGKPSKAITINFKYKVIHQYRTFADGWQKVIKHFDNYKRAKEFLSERISLRCGEHIHFVHDHFECSDNTGRVLDVLRLDTIPYVKDND